MHINDLCRYLIAFVCDAKLTLIFVKQCHQCRKMVNKYSKKWWSKEIRGWVSDSKTTRIMIFRTELRKKGKLITIFHSI